jgi:hypothetical protein
MTTNLHTHRAQHHYSETLRHGVAVTGHTLALVVKAVVVFTTVLVSFLLWGADGIG